ncbi:MAG: hypothetical protein KAX13_12525, partial [Candidatus Krumholzibacteria bacterium]|nr:hypothetical protein [Candidatus Krumholzibacteria bacterium]
MRYYQAKFRASGPPPAPVLSCPGQLAGPSGAEFNPDIHGYRIYYTDSGSVTLTWDGQESETTPDRNTSAPDFEGYKLYKSTDRGLTWGESVIDRRGRWIGYVSVAQFDLNNSVEGENPIGGFWLGDNSGLVHSWTDADVLDGYEYWYLITAYDYTPSDSTYESHVGGDPKTNNNIVAVVPGVRPAGWVDGRLGTGATAGTTIDLYAPTNDYETTISAVVVDQSVITGDFYSVSVVDSGRYGGVTYDYWGGLKVRNTTENDYLVWTATIPQSQLYGNDLIPVTEGFRVVTDQPNNGDGGVCRLMQTTDVTPDTTYILAFYEAYMEASGS